jgi:putative MATE family efflux protein
VSPGIERRLLEAPIGSTLLRLAAPNLLNPVGLIALLLVDSLVVSRLGPEALASVALVFPVVMLVHSVAATGVGSATASAVAHAFGAADGPRVTRLIGHALVVAAALAFATSLLLVGLGAVVLGRLSQDAEVLRGARSYAAIVVLLTIAPFVAHVLAGALRGMGRMLYPSLTMLAGSLAYACGAPFLVLGWGPIPGAGVAGAAAGLMAVYVLAAVLLAVHPLLRRQLASAFRPLSLDRRLLADILVPGLPGSLNAVIPHICVLIATAIMSAFGVAGLAGYGLAARIDYLIVPVAFSFGTALVTLVAANVGARQMTRARDATRVGATLAAAIACVIGVATAVLAGRWMALFTDDPDVALAGITYLRVAGPVYGALALGLVLYYVSVATGRVPWSLAANACRLVILGLAAVIGIGSLWAASLLIAATFVLYGGLSAATTRIGEAGAR